MIDLQPSHLAEVQRILREQVPGVRVCAFGSRVVGRARKFSDLDLALMTEQKTDWRVIDSLLDAFSESDLPIMVDVLDWAVLKPSFRRVIEPQLTPIQQA